MTTNETTSETIYEIEMTRPGGAGTYWIRLSRAEVDDLRAAGKYEQLRRIARHTFEPLPLDDQDEKCRRDGCGPRCYCAICGQAKGDRARHIDWRRNMARPAQMAVRTAARATAILAMIATIALSGAGVARAAEPIPLRVPVLMYHRIECADATTRLPGLFVCPAQLDAQMARLQAAGWHTITADELAADYATGTCPAPKTFVITVDDGALDGYTNGAPIWEAHGYRATFAMVTGKAGDYLTGGGGAKPHFSWDQARDLVARGFGIANHTVMHTAVANDSTAQLDAEVQAAQDQIEHELGFAPAVFVYPYGSTGTAETSYLAARFTLAFTTRAGALETPADPMHSPRIRVSRSTTPAQLQTRMRPFRNACPA